MVLNHLAAILVFAGPLFYCGVWMVADPTGLARLIETVAQPRGYAETSWKIRAGVRCAGAVLMLAAIAL